jgi:molybdopterin synthase sulfur carrier subunit|tara:strand:+ start:113 stop:358 length:246 start_codon:yes stop_codon:yes gene_type:complete
VKIKLLFFASCRNIIGDKELIWDISENVTVGDVKKELALQYPGLIAMEKTLSIAVNAEYVDDSIVLFNEDEIAFIPPVSGG